MKPIYPLLLILIGSPALVAGMPQRNPNPGPGRIRETQTATGVRGDVMFLSEETTRGDVTDSRAVESSIRMTPSGSEARPRFYIPADRNVLVEFNKYSVQLYALPGLSESFLNKTRPISDSVMAHDLDGAMTTLNRIYFAINSKGVADPAWNVMTVTLSALEEQSDPISAFARAADMLGQMMDLDTPAQLLAALDQAAFHEAAGQYEEASCAFIVALSRGARSMPGALRRLGVLHSLAGDSWSARIALLAAVSADAEDAQAWLLLGALQLGAAENMTAEKSLNRSLELDSDCIDAHVLKARLYSSLKNPFAAIAEMDVAIRLAEEQIYPAWYRSMLARTRARYQMGMLLKL